MNLAGTRGHPIMKGETVNLVTELEDIVPAFVNRITGTGPGGPVLQLSVPAANWLTTQNVPYANPFYGYQPMSWHYQSDNLEVDVTDMQDAQKRGAELGTAFGILFDSTAGSGDKVRATMIIAERFCQIEGYSDVRRGMQYIQGFTTGFSAASPKLLSGAINEENNT